MKKVLIGMSGGVDSSVAAYLLKKEGYEVLGVTMTLFKGSDTKAVNDAKKVCEKLNIEHEVIDLSSVFKDKVIDNFIEEYKSGKTPNPCVVCNRYLKFGALWDYAKEHGCDYIATGHYARVEDGKLIMIDSPKDQSYFMYNIKKEVLPHILLPLNTYTSKDEIRAIASSIGLEVATKKDSQDICFIENNDYPAFLLKQGYKPKKGNFILKDGTILGTHEGIINYTIGQRKGLGISYSKPLYVININIQDNTVTLGDEKDLYRNELIITNTNILVDELPQECTAKIRFKSPLYPCNIEKIDDNNLKVTFNEPIKSITAGQSCVLYKDNICLGGGIIRKDN